MDAVAHFSQLARYNALATARLLDAVHAVEEAELEQARAQAASDRGAPDAGAPDPEDGPGPVSRD